jgi:CheY-like chemotaxis protein
MHSMGHETRVAYDGPAAIAMAEEFEPEIVLVDLGMPVMNGYEVARALRSGNRARHIVAVTGWGHDAAKRQTREAGFDHHLVKPVTEASLIELLAEFAARRAIKQ